MTCGFLLCSEIGDRNKGRKMLEKMGWKKGEGLGKTGDGMRDPVSGHVFLLIYYIATNYQTDTFFLLLQICSRVFGCRCRDFTKGW